MIKIEIICVNYKIHNNSNKHINLDDNYDDEENAKNKVWCNTCGPVFDVNMKVHEEDIIRNCSKRRA